MGVRVTIPTPSSIPGASGSPIADNFINTLGQAKAPIDALGNLGGSVNGMLQDTSNNLTALTKNPVGQLADSVDVNIGAINGGLGVAVKAGPPAALASLSQAPGNIANAASSAKSAFDTAKAAVTGTNGAIALAVAAACLLFGNLLQGLMQKALAEILRLQRTILAKIDQLRKKVEDLINDAIKKAVSAVMEIIPECPSKIKEVIKELKSILGKASTIIAAINSFLKDAAACLALGGAVAAALAEMQNKAFSLANMVRNSKYLISFDFTAFSNMLSTGFGSQIDNIIQTGNVYNDTDYLRVEVTQKLEDAEREAQAAKERLEELKKKQEEYERGEVDPETGERPGDEWKPVSEAEYKRIIEELLKRIDELLEELAKARENLEDEVRRIINEMINGTVKDLENIEDRIKDDIEDIKESMEQLYDKLEKIAEEFDDPAVQEQIVTSCTETTLRTVVEDQK